MKNLIYSMLLLSFSCVNQGTQKTQAETNQIEDKNVSLEKRAAKVMDILIRKDFAALAEQIEMGQDLLFSPYGYIDTTSAIRFSKEKLKQAATQQQKINWGEYDGTGDPIELNIAEYFDKFVTDKDYLKCGANPINETTAVGNTVNNLEEVFPGYDFIEYYCKGSDKYSFMDWGALRLVYKVSDDKIYLVAIVHDQWTI